MVERSPLVYVEGNLSQLPPGSSIEGVSAGTITAGSGLVGGGDLSTGSKRLDLALAASPSGLIFVGDTLALDGADLRKAESALASGNAGLAIGEQALSSGITAQVEADVALASGNAALFDAANYQSGTLLTLTAAGVVQTGNPVGFDDSGRIQAVSSGVPTINGLTNFIGIAQQTVSSGSNINVLVPKGTDYTRTDLTTGRFYYVDPVASGFTTASGVPATWSGFYTWAPVAKAVSSSGLLLLNNI